MRAANRTVERRLFVLLGALALICAFVSGLKTVYDPDFFWQLASGRWIAQHHRIFSTDVFSYTAAGQPWVYPVGSALLFYAAYLSGGYVLLSWMGAAVCVGSVALLLRRGSATTAALAVLAVPLISSRTSARADMFTVLLFAAFLSLLWESYRGRRARLWLLPVLMLAWVNLHPGFISGVGLLLAFAGLDALDLLRPSLRVRAIDRVRRGWPWFAAALAATLVNPWGWGAYTALLRQSRAMAAHSEWFAEWGRMPLSWFAIARGFSLDKPTPFYLILVLTVLAIVVALLRREFGAALLLAAAAYEGVRHVRMQALMGSMAVVIGGAMLAGAVEYLGSRKLLERRRIVLATVAASVVALTGVVWTYRLNKPSETALWAYGAGLGWWFPERAADYVRQQKIPGEIFHAYEQGGYLMWKLAPEYRDYIDGRALPFGPEAYIRQRQLLASAPDSAEWDAEVNRYHISTVFLPLHRFQAEVGMVRAFCNSAKWVPVYLDERAAIFVRRTAENGDVIARTQVNCATTPVLKEPPAGTSFERFNAWANAAVVFAALGRNSDALYATSQAEEVMPNTTFVPWMRGNVAYAMGLRDDAEQEYRKGISVDSGMPLLWFSLAAVYKHEGKIPETIEAQRKGIAASIMPQPFELLKLARLYLDAGQPKEAIATFDEVIRSSSPDLLESPGGQNLLFQVDQGRAAAWRALGDTGRAATFDQKAAQDLVRRK